MSSYKHYTVTHFEPRTEDEDYTAMRTLFKRCIQSRSRVISLYSKQTALVERLESDLAAFARDAQIDLQEKAHLLQIVGEYKAIFKDMEAAGNELVGAADDYDKGLAWPYGMNPVGRLVEAVRKFVAAWKALKKQDQTKKLETSV